LSAKRNQNPFSPLVIATLLFQSVIDPVMAGSKTTLIGRICKKPLPVAHFPSSVLTNEMAPPETTPRLRSLTEAEWPAGCPERPDISPAHPCAPRRAFSRARPQRAKRRGGTTRTLCGRSPLEWILANGNSLQYFQVSGRRENAAGGLCQQPARYSRSRC
jgi:hypothetical protein